MYKFTNRNQAAFLSSLKYFNYDKYIVEYNPLRLTYYFYKKTRLFFMEKNKCIEIWINGRQLILWQGFPNVEYFVKQVCIGKHNVFVRYFFCIE
ncbi:MAG: hypothetical protein A2Y10_11890 [Planctomycetes bacterium GWF2_41_51]|nr:MAG: hypothetical protein A2Y10_11890 [Planctomycetes bacterium GWF2_41_51]HBG28646.1 hypothetical protein [Phycisphaerales bacterium]